MKVKVNKVIEGIYDYDSIIVNIDNIETEIVFNKCDKILQYEGKEIELIDNKGIFKIKPISTSSKKID